MSIVKMLGQPEKKISVIELVNLLIEYAYLTTASDIHIEPTEDNVRVRYRIDGLLRDLLGKEPRISKNLHHEIISRIKVMAGLRTDEHSVPQDGRFRVKIEGIGNIDVRISIMATYYGENAILRVLAETHAFTLEELGFSPKELETVKKAIEKPYGMILANGPTGSGKTTTLYTMLKKLNLPETSIITIEDPIEYSLAGLTQIQVNNQVGLTFATGLRSILRQDPNIVMVGEIRDQETAGIAVNAALTGHLVLSTLHTNDAATTFPRLIDMGVPPFLVASTINITMGQRLVRMLCQKCKKERALSDEELKSLHELLPELDHKHFTFYKAVGCAECNDTGYKGRTAVQEVLEINDEIRKLIMDRANASQIKEAAIKHGMATMVEDSLAKATNGITSLEEVLRIIHE